MNESMNEQKPSPKLLYIVLQSAEPLSPIANNSSWLGQIETEVEDVNFTPSQCLSIKRDV